MYILGISYGIDSAASLIRDGKIIAAVQEERLNREKHSRRFPVNAIHYCLQQAKITLKEVHKISFFWNPGIHLENLNIRFSSRWRDHVEYLYNLPNYLLELLPVNINKKHVEDIVQTLNLPGLNKKIEIHYIKHHLSHAASSFFVSPFEKSAILTVDGYGERTSTMLAYGNRNRITVLKEINYPHSLGALYATFTQYLGYYANSEEGKVMGLAGYGNPDKYNNQFNKIININKKGDYELDLSYFSYYLHGPRRYSDKLVKTFGPERKRDASIEQRHRDIAAGLQKTLEKALISVINSLYSQTNCKNLCLAGGVALNSVANSMILKKTHFQKIFIQPAAGDAGDSLGSALYLYHQKLDKKRNNIMTDDYLGPGFSSDEIKNQLDHAKITYKYKKEIALEGAKLISQGKIIGWFQGRMEFGPRALGNRSILADPRIPKMKEILNNRVKQRENFRPYAPSVLIENYKEWFEGNHPSPFMLLVSKVKTSKKSLIPAIVHVDGTARVQTVNKTTNPLFWQLINHFKNITGIPMVLNTSFNLRGEPIVCSIKDALHCFFTSGMDYLILGNYLIKKS